MNYIADGNLHALDFGYGYALQILDGPIIMSAQDKTFKKIIRKFTKEYNKYRSRNGKEPIKSVFHQDPCLQEVSIVYKPDMSDECLQKKATLALKFKRFDNDGLE